MSIDVNNPIVQEKVAVLLVAAIRRLGKDIFDESQQLVPVVTGRLRGSGVIGSVNRGVEITYHTPYARDVEFGRKGGADITNQHVQTVPSHVRRTKNGKRIRVRAHTKQFTSGKPVQLPDGQWRVFKTTQATKGRLFLTRAMERVLRKALTHTNGLQPYIR